MFLCWVVLMVVGVAESSRCPAWFNYNNGTRQCECPHLKAWGVRCNQQELLAEVANGYCVSYLDDALYAADCEYKHTGNFTDRMYLVMPTNPNKLNQVMCGSLNRQGLLCGQCIDEYGPAIYSIDNRCADCSKIPAVLALAFYIMVEFIPILIFFIIVAVFRINITRGPLLGYVFFCQLYVLNARTRNSFVLSTILGKQSFPVQLLVYSSLVLAGIWSLKFPWIFLPNFCLSRHLTGIQVQLLELVPPITTIFIMIQTSVLIELHKRNCRLIVEIWKTMGVCLKKLRFVLLDGTAVIHTFATFIFLSGYNLNYVLIEMMTHDPVSQSDGSFYRYIVANDPSITWFSHTHIAYLSAIFISCIVLVFLPALLLSVYPTRIYQTLSEAISGRKQIAIKTFAEALHQCFKDGLHGTSDFRFVAGFTLIFGATFSLVTFYIYKFTHSSYDFTFFSGTLLIFLSIIFAFLRPCKNVITDISLGYHTMVLGFLAMALNLWRRALSFDTDTLEILLIILPAISHVFIFSWAGYFLVIQVILRCSKSSTGSL